MERLVAWLPVVGSDTHLHYGTGRFLRSLTMQRNHLSTSAQMIGSANTFAPASIMSKIDTTIGEDLRSFCTLFCHPIAIAVVVGTMTLHSHTSIISV